MANRSSYQFLFHHDVPKDLEDLPANIQDRILKAIEERLTQAPDQYGERLRQSLQGYWKRRLGDYRVVFEIANHQVRVYGVMDRREVYTAIAKRTSMRMTREASCPKKAHAPATALNEGGHPSFHVL